MDWLNRMNSAIGFIEDNITENIDYDRVAEIACCSVYHFQRMFSFITEIPLSEYIRRRRFTLAAFELQNSDARIIDLAVKYGYDSADSFSRAFQKIHGVTPSLAHDKGVQLKAYPRISFQISIKGDVEMEYRIEEKEAFSVFGKDILLKQEEDLYVAIPKFGDEIWENGIHDKINDIAGNSRGTMLYGIHFDFMNDGSRRYMFAWNKPINSVPEEFCTIDIPKAMWVVFNEKGKMPDSLAIQNIWKRVYTEWFPTSGYEQARGPCIEKYYWVDEKKEEYTCEVWIPIIKK